MNLIDTRLNRYFMWWMKWLDLFQSISFITLIELLYGD